MSCTHTDSCPLHPKLNASLSGWKSSYCDTEQAWVDCARYQMSVAGKPVPLALLPNGKVLGILVEPTVRNAEPKIVAAESGSGGVAVMTDVQADVALEQAAASTGGFFSRFRKLFGGPK